MNSKSRSLEILLYGKPIGLLTHLGGDRSLFSFYESYIEDSERPTLGLGFKGDLNNALITEHHPTQTRLIPFFSNILPEGHMRDYLAKRSGIKPMREFFLLEALGKDLPGALTVRVLEDASHSPMEEKIHSEHISLSEEGPLRFSLAGVQLKFSGIQEATGGLTIPITGERGSWIVKLPSSQFAHVPETEFSMLMLAKMVGIDVPEIALIDTKSIHGLPKEMQNFNGQSFMIKRFDRTLGGELIHSEDFAQVFGVYPEDKYNKGSFRNILEVIARESTEHDVMELIRRLTFNVLIGNADMHLKNWSLIYKDKKRPSLAPAYDFVSTIAYIPDEKMALKVSRTKRFDSFTKDELAHLAIKTGLSESLVMNMALETIESFHKHWALEKKNLPLSLSVIKAIDEHVKKIPLAKR